MPWRSLDYRKMKAMEDERKMAHLQALTELTKKSTPDPTAEIPGTGPEKIVYNMLKRLRLRFRFQYHETDLESTSFPEDIYIPDFILPDYNIRISVFGAYWHSMLRRRENDLLQAARNLFAGRTVYEHGVKLLPSGGQEVGKYVIWWDYEIYRDLDYLFVRDLPELFARDRVTGEPEKYILDKEHERDVARARKAQMIAHRLRPKVHPYERRLRKQRRENFDITRVYPMLRRRDERIRNLHKSPYDGRGKKKKRSYQSLKSKLEKEL